MKDRKLILVIILLITLAFTSCSSTKYNSSGTKMCTAVAPMK